MRVRELDRDLDSRQKVLGSIPTVGHNVHTLVIEIITNGLLGHD